MSYFDAKTQQVVSGTATYDPWVDQASKDIYEKAQGATGEYTPYEGDRVAPLTANLQAANAAANTYKGAEFRRDYFEPAQDLIKDNKYTAQDVNVGDVSTNRMTGAGLQPYMNPYIESVVTPQLKEREEQYKRDLEAMKRTQAQKSAFGGSRGVIEAELKRQGFEREKERIQNEGYATAFDKASDLFMTDEERVLNAALANQTKDVDLGKFNEGSRQKQAEISTDQARALGTLGTQFSNVKNDIVKRLLDTGRVTQEQAQLVADRAYGDYLDERGWDKEQVEFLTGTLSNVPKSTTSTKEAILPSDFANTLGAIEGGLDLVGSLTGLGISDSVAKGAQELAKSIGVPAALETLGLSSVSSALGLTGAASAGEAALLANVTGALEAASASGAGLASVAGTAGAGSAGAGLAGGSTVAAGTTLASFAQNVLPPLAIMYGISAVSGIGGPSKYNLREASSQGTVQGGKVNFAPVKAKKLESKYVIPLQRDAQDMISELQAQGVNVDGVGVGVGMNNAGPQESFGGKKYVNETINEVIGGLPAATRDKLLRSYQESERMAEKEWIKSRKDSGSEPPPAAGFIDLSVGGEAAPRIPFVNKTEDEILRDLGVYDLDPAQWGFAIDDLNLDAIMTKDRAFDAAQKIIAQAGGAVRPSGTPQPNSGAGIPDLSVAF